MYFKELQVPADVKVEFSGNIVKASGPKGALEKKLELIKDIKIEVAENKVKVSSENERRKVKALIGTTVAHIKNAVEGVSKGFTYRLRVVYSHFPITVKIEGNRFLIQNFIGERVPRVAKIIGKTQVKLEGSDVIVTGIDLDEVSHTASRIEQACRIVGYDKKKFMDGIYIVSKGE